MGLLFGIHTLVGIVTKESVQKQFLLFCLRGLGRDYANGFPSYEARLGCKLWNIEGLF